MTPRSLLADSYRLTAGRERGLLKSTHGFTNVVLNDFVRVEDS